MRLTSCSADISSEKMHTALPVFAATLEAIFSTKEVFPIPGRAPTRIRSDFSHTGKHSVQPAEAGGQPLRCLALPLQGVQLFVYTADNLPDASEVAGIAPLRDGENPVLRIVQNMYDRVLLGVGDIGNVAAHLDQLAQDTLVLDDAGVVLYVEGARHHVHQRAQVLRGKVAVLEIPVPDRCPAT